MIKHFNQRNIQISLTLFVLFGLLTYGFFHVAAMFERISLYWWIGYLMAAACEISVFSLSLAIGWRKANKETKKSLGYFLLALLIPLYLNMLGNVTEGFYIKYGVELEWSNFSQLGIIAIIVAVSTSLPIPIITMAQSEILGDFIFQVFKSIAKNEKETKRKTEAKKQIDNFGLPEQERRQAILEHYQKAYNDNVRPMTQKKLSQAFDVSLIVIQSDLKTLVLSDKIKKVGRAYRLNK